MKQINIPNYVPQSPTWLILLTSYPVYSKILQSDSPIMVDLKCPTCISLAILGEEKSTAIVLLVSLGGCTHPRSNNN